MRLIDADELIKKAIPKNPDAQFRCVSVNDIINAPTVKAQSERTGKWIEVHGFCTPGGDPVWACSECGKGIHVYGIEHGTYGADVSDGQWKACPNCGARMLKEGEEHDGT